MKNKFKLLTVGLGLLALPIINANAANYSLIGSTTANVATYEIKYSVDPTIPEGDKSISFNIEKPNDGLDYKIEKSSSLTGSCDEKALSCTIISDEALTEGTVLATLTITNNSTEDKTTTIAISGKEETKTTIALPAGNTTTQKIKSSEATLSEISISIGTMDQTFSKDISTYNVTGIKDTINTVRVTPDCDNNCSWKLVCPNGECSISNSTTVNLAQGANQVSIMVESEDGTLTKTYVLNIYRGDIELNSPYLSNITIKDGTLSPKFDSMVNDYTLIVGLDVEKLDLEAIPEDPSANVLIKGNENLKVGENTITITVTSKDGQNKQVYTIIVTKEEIETEETDEVIEEIKTNKVDKKKNNKTLIIILSIIGLILIIGGYFVIFKIRKNKKNNKNNKNNSSKNNNNKKEEKELEETEIEEQPEEKKEKTTKEKIEEITKEIVIPNVDNEPKQDVDEALEDLMKTKQLELGDLDF